MEKYTQLIYEREIECINGTLPLRILSFAELKLLDLRDVTQLPCERCSRIEVNDLDGEISVKVCHHEWIPRPAFNTCQSRSP